MPWRKETSELGKAGELNTIIGKGTVVEGSISVQNSLRVDGRINGNLSTTESVVVGKDGEINGEVRVGNAVIGGRIEGKVIAKGKVVLESKSFFRGEMKTSKLVIDEGAFFDGNCMMEEQQRDRKNAVRVTTPEVEAEVLSESTEESFPET
jgi:cytoskeletal protein CcmA (bactofilin family)